MLNRETTRCLLVLACSGRKKRDPGLLPALDRYDGVNYRVLKKLRREGRWPTDVDVFIVSARYGLLSAEAPIPYYDDRMTTARARELAQQISDCLDGQVGRARYREILVNVGAQYLAALDRCESLRGPQVLYSHGGIGQRMSDMRAWLISKIPRKTT